MYRFWAATLGLYGQSLIIVKKYVFQFVKKKLEFYSLVGKSFYFIEPIGKNLRSPRNVQITDRFVMFRESEVQLPPP